MSLGNLKVYRVVGRCDLDSAGAEGFIDNGIRYDGNPPVHNWQHHIFPN